MKISNVSSTIATLHKMNTTKAYKDKQVIYLTSSPGVGKSSVVHQTGKSLNIPVIEFRPANHGIEDLIGLPTFNHDRSESNFATPSWLPNETRDGEEGILFIDEVPQASKAMLNALSQLFLDGRIHDYYLPPKWSIIAAGNRIQDRAAANRMPTHLTNRLTPEIEVQFNADDWMKWAMNTNVRSELIAFVKFDPTVVDSFDPDSARNCTPRSLTKCSDLLDLQELVRQELLVGTIGEAAAVKLAGYLRVWSQLPDLDDVLRDPEKTSLPDNERRDLQYAVTFALVSRADATTFDTIMRYITRLPAEFQTTFVKAALEKDTNIHACAAFTDFLKNNRDLIY